MSAVLDALVPTATGKRKKSLPVAMEQYKFKPGHAPLRGAGRPVGSKNAATIYLESLPFKAQQWVKSTDAAILIDARKLALPDKALPSASPQVVVFVGDVNLLPRSVAADALPPVLPVADGRPLLHPMPAVPVAVPSAAS